MPLIRFVEPSGTEHAVEAESGQTVMEAATGSMVPGIVGECGGSCSCATCHVYIDAAWAARIGTADEMEAMMLECAADPAPDSRLCCQITVADTLDGMIVRIPAGQL